MNEDDSLINTQALRRLAITTSRSLPAARSICTRTPIDSQSEVRKMMA